MLQGKKVCFGLLGLMKGKKGTLGPLRVVGFLGLRAWGLKVFEGL